MGLSGSSGFLGLSHRNLDEGLTHQALDDRSTNVELKTLHTSWHACKILQHSNVGIQRNVESGTVRDLGITRICCFAWVVSPEAR